MATVATATADSCGLRFRQGVFRLPRSKPIPKEKPKTRWQKFMEATVGLFYRDLSVLPVHYSLPPEMTDFWLGGDFNPQLST